MYLKSSTKQDTSFPQTGESSHEDSLETSSGNYFYTPQSVTPVTWQIQDTSDPPSESKVEVKIFSLYLYNAFFLVYMQTRGPVADLSPGGEARLEDFGRMTRFSGKRGEEGTVVANRL